MSTKIFVMAHKRYEEPEDTVYQTLQVGRETGDQTLPYMGDNTGENISSENCYYGELTGYYWVWKNYHESDYVGICHYRRFYLDENGSLMTEAGFEQILSEYDAIVSNRNISDQTNEEGYGESHNINDLLATGRAIAKLTPEYSEAFKQMLTAKYSYYANLLVTGHENYDAYCNWLFQILGEASKEIDVSTYDNYHRRVYGFLSELLLMVWILGNHYKVYESKIGITSEKAETVELKDALATLVAENAYKKARETYYEYMKKRPDVRLGQSDLTQDLPVMECVLYILEEEENIHQKGFSKVSDSLTELVAHYRKLIVILTALGNGTADEQMVQYLIDTNVTGIAVEVILRNTAGINGELVRKILGFA